MTSAEFEQEIKKLDARFSVVENPNRPGLSNIFFLGKNYDLPVISTHNIPEVYDPSNRYEFPNGWSQAHHTREEIVARLKTFLEKFKDGSIANLYAPE